MRFCWAFLVVTACALPPPPHIVTTRDGINLATHVWLPPSSPGAKWPAVLRRTPYGKDVALQAVAGLLAGGYAVVSQDVRGRGGSQGTFDPFFHDGEDGADTIAWIAKQSWSNGKVATFGGSAEGIVQLMAAAQNPEALKCSVVHVATSDLHHALFPGGAWRDELTTAWLKALNAPDVLSRWRAHEAQDAFWDPVRLSDDELANIQVPMIHVGGFFDIFASDVPRTHSGISRRHGDQFLVMGPWTHGGLQQVKQGEITFNDDAKCEECSTELLAFLGWCLKDGKKPEIPSVRYFVSTFSDDGKHAEGAWKTADSWPPPSSAVDLHLRADGTLAVEAESVTTEKSIPVDPAHPIPSKGGGNLTTAAGPHDQSAVDGNEGVMLFSRAVDGAVELAGDVRAQLWVKSATADLDVVIRLEDVTREGKAMLLTDGIRRGRFARGVDASRPLIPGEAVLFDVELGPIAVTLPEGHALRIAISGSSAPRYEVNPNTGDPLTAHPTPVTTSLSVLMDGAHPSRITLPVVSGALH